MALPLLLPPPLGCPNNGIYQNGIQALTYVTSNSLSADMTVCWRWTQLITGTTNLPAPWTYREAFLTAPQCREFGNRPPGQDGSQNAGRQITCPTCTPAPTPTPTPTPTPAPPLRVLPVPADYNADAIADFAVYRTGDHMWWINSLPGTTQYGFHDSVPVPADYNGDGRDDIAVYRTSDHMWWINSLPSTVQWGFPGDIPVPADYDGDHRADIAIYRPQDGHWWIAYSSGRPSGDQGTFGFPTS